MTLITKNQNDNLNEEFNDVYEIKYVFSNTFISFACLYDT